MMNRAIEWIFIILSLLAVTAFSEEYLGKVGISPVNTTALDSEEAIILKLRNATNRGLMEEIYKTGFASVAGGIVGSVFGLSWPGLLTVLKSGGASNLVYMNFCTEAILKGAALGALSLVSRVYLRTPADFVFWPLSWFGLTKKRIENWIIYEGIPPETSKDISNFIDPVFARLKTVVEQIFQVPASSWTLVVLEGMSESILAGPAYRILFYRPMLAITKNQAELSCALGHEMGHLLSAHVGQSALDTLLFQKWGVASLPFTNAISHEIELQADEIGIYLTALAGYDPSECPEVMRRIGIMTGDIRPIINMFISTHPTSKKRTNEMKKLSNQLKGYYSRHPNPLGLGMEYNL